MVSQSGFSVVYCCRYLLRSDDVFLIFFAVVVRVFANIRQGIVVNGEWLMRWRVMNLSSGALLSDSCVVVNYFGLWKRERS